MEVPKTDLQNFIKYLEDAARLYDALAPLPMQKCSCRAHMIKKGLEYFPFDVGKPGPRMRTAIRTD